MLFWSTNVFMIICYTTSLIFHVEIAIFHMKFHHDLESRSKVKFDILFWYFGYMFGVVCYTMSLDKMHISCQNGHCLHEISHFDLEIRSKVTFDILFWYTGYMFGVVCYTMSLAKMHISCWNGHFYIKFHVLTLKLGQRSNLTLYSGNLGTCLG